MTSEIARARGMLLALIVAGSIQGAAYAAADSAAVAVARAGTLELTDAQVRSLVGLLGDTARSNLSAHGDLLRTFVRSQLIEQALVAEAQAAHFESASGTREHLEQARRKDLATLWIARQSTPPADYPDDAQVRAAYEAGKAAAPTEFHFAQIFVRAPGGDDPAQLAAALHKASAVADRLSAPEFASLARQFSDDAQSAAKGGDSGFVASGNLSPELLDALRRLEPGQVTGPIRDFAGFYFIELTERRTAPLPPLESVRGRIVAELRARRQHELEQAYLASLTQRLDIQVDQAALARLQGSL